LLNQQHLILTAPFTLNSYLKNVAQQKGSEAEQEAIRSLAHIDSHLQGNLTFSSLLFVKMFFSIFSNCWRLFCRQLLKNTTALYFQCSILTEAVSLFCIPQSITVVLQIFEFQWTKVTHIELPLLHFVHQFRFLNHR
jgi:hypothetical protein